MTVGEVKKQSSRNSRINLSNTLVGKKIKPSSNHTVTHKHTAAKQYTTTGAKHTSSHMTTNLIEGKNEAEKYDVERRKTKQSETNEKRNFGRAMLLKDKRLMEI